MITLFACGNGETQSLSTTINQPPTVNAGASMSVDELSEVEVTGSASDEDGTVVSYYWSQTLGTSVTLENQDSATLSFTAPEVEFNETLEFQLLVTDNEGTSSTASVKSKSLIQSSNWLGNR